MPSRALRLFHTVRHLKPIQITGRVATKLRRLRPDLRPAPAIRHVLSSWDLPAWREPSLLGPHRFRFLNQTRDIVAAGDWDRADWPRLWVYNLHYFDDLGATDAPSRAHWHLDLIGRWIKENPAPSGAGWEPYCLSLRIVNWIRWAWSGSPLSPAALDNLAVQVRALADQIEVHLLGNHLFANAKALVFAGLFFEGAEADGWLAMGLRYLNAELQEQILDDGAHFERSPMYHAVIACDVVEILEADRVVPGRLPTHSVADLSDAAQRMLRWAQVMSHPDGDIAFFNDSAFGIAPTLANLERMAACHGLVGEPTPPELVELVPSGYVRMEAGSAVLLADVGEVGPTYLPGHAHADTLSFELSLNGKRFLVNTGTSEYVGERRLFERGTSSHNTVVVNGADSSEVWSSFRVAQRARPFDVSSAKNGETLILTASHDGYRRYPQGPNHRRRWDLRPDGLTIEDVLDRDVQLAEAWFHLHPEVSVARLGDVWVFSCRGVLVSTATFDDADVEAVAGFWAPKFGQLVSNQALRVRFPDRSLISHFRWVGSPQKRRS